VARGRLSYHTALFQEEGITKKLWQRGIGMGLGRERIPNQGGVETVFQRLHIGLERESYWA